ncbi:DNA replication protein 4 [Xylariales sp. AK1849]|nr:DNA replication protein 4 [Xylariales sp. AK1849]
MLKSTYQPSAKPLPPLPPGWSEHKAPTGHTYFYNENTKKSTYKRPGSDISAAAPQDPQASYRQYSSVGSLSNPAAANAFLAQYNPQHAPQQRQPFGSGERGGRGGYAGDRPRPQPHDKPRSKIAIPGCEPWILVYTKYGRRFVYNPTKNASYWRIPEKVMKGILDLDIRGIKDKASGDAEKSAGAEAKHTASAAEAVQEEQREELGSDYEEVEVTDDEDEGADGSAGDEEGAEHRSKRQRTEDPTEEDAVPVEFNEEDIAFQLQAMGEEYGLDPGEYDDGNPEAWPEGAEGLPMSDEDARELFKDLLNDWGINPYSPWDKLIEDGKIIDDTRYTVLPNMKARKDVWEEWSRAQIQILKERRAKEEKSDPRIPYMAFLQAKATPKLYWPEFRRKYRKEAPLRDTSLSDKEREKCYREYITRLKLPLDTLKKDLNALLRSVQLKDLNNKTLPENLPSQLLGDVRYVSLDPMTRDPLIEAYIATLPAPPDQAEVEEDEMMRKAREERRKREKAMQDRERIVAEEKRRQDKRLQHGRAALREEERELEKAQQIGKKGLQSHLLADKEKAKAADTADADVQ